MGLWKRIKENRLEKAAKVRAGRKKAILPKSVLLWIDAAYNDTPARIVRGLAIAEAFRKAGVERVSLACLGSVNFPAEAESRDIKWIDSRPNGNPITFNEIVKTAEADLTIADSAAPPRLPNDIDVLLYCLLSDVFSTALLEADWIDAVLMPGSILPPDFETVRLLPSRIGDCIHGVPYVSLPSDYTESPNQDVPRDRIVIAVSGNVSPESVRSLLNAVRGSWTGTVSVLADVSPAIGQRLKEELSGELELTLEPSISQRLTLFRGAKLALAFPVLHVYELFALGAPVILMPRSESEAILCRSIVDRTAARMISANESIETLQQAVKDLLENDGAREELGASAGAFVPADGADELVEALLSRFERRSRGRQLS